MKYALPEISKFSLNTDADARMAERYFLENEQEIPLKYRREYCKNLMEKQAECGLPTDKRIAHYASDNLDPEGYKISLKVREIMLEKTAGVAQEISILMQNTGSIQDIIKALTDFDQRHGLDYYWDSRIPNPVLTTLKVPDNDEIKPEVYIQGADKATGDQLRALKYRRQTLEKLFSHEAVDELTTDPIAALKNLTPEEVSIVLQIAHDEV